jgi:hypothetical protein
MNSPYLLVLGDAMAISKNLIDFNTNTICVNSADTCIRLSKRPFYIGSALLVTGTILFKNRKSVLKSIKKVF